MTPWWGMMIRRTPQARITNHRITNQGVKTAWVRAKPPGWPAPRLRYAAIRYRNAAKAARKRGEIPLRDEVARARAGIQLSAAAAWHPPWLKWRVSLVGTHRPDSPIPPAIPPGQPRSGEVCQASKHFGFALSQGNQPRTLAGEILKRRNGSGLP